MSHFIKFTDLFIGKKKHFKTCKKYRDANRIAIKLTAVLDSGKASDMKKKNITKAISIELCIAGWGYPHMLLQGYL